MQFTGGVSNYTYFRNLSLKDLQAVVLDGPDQAGLPWPDFSKGNRDRAYSFQIGSNETANDGSFNKDPQFSFTDKGWVV